MSGTLLFSGVDLSTVCIVEDLSDFWSSSDLRGDLPVYAGVSGATPIRRPISSKVCSGQLQVVDEDTLADTEDAVAAVKALLRPARAQTVTRRKVTGDGNLDATQTAIVRTVEERWQTQTVCTLLIGVELLDGGWAGAEESIASAAGTQAVKGDLPTAAIVATLSAGAANPIVANTTNGYSFRYVGTIPSGGVEVDVLTRRATGLTGSVDMSANLRWSKSDPFQLDPGDNVITVSAGTCALDYTPAYE